MKLGLSVGYWGAGPPPFAEEQVSEADLEGIDSVWTSEAYGSDAFTPLAWWGSHTRNVKLGTAIAQMSARTPTATAMAALSLDHLSGGRMVLGIGASGPKVVEGWYGQEYARPLERTREYISIMRAVWARESPVTFEGRHYQLPRDTSTGLGKALKSTVHPLRPDIPVYLGAEGPKNVALAAEIADGWLPMWFSPKSDDFYRGCLAEGFGRDGARHDVSSFEVAGLVPVVEHDDVEVAADFLRPVMALYIGGMGTKTANFHHDVFVRMGWSEVCDDVFDRYAAGDTVAAAAAIPTAMVEDVALIGSADKIIDDYRKRWRETCLTTLVLAVWPGPDNRGCILDAIRQEQP